MKNLSRPFMVIFLGLLLSSAVLLTLGPSLAADKSDSAETYYPPSESAGG